METILQPLAWFIDNAETLGPYMGAAFLAIIFTCATVNAWKAR